MKYDYAVIDGNKAPDQSIRPESCHRSYERAASAARRANGRDPNAHFYVVEWGASQSAKLSPNDAHYSCDRWIKEG